MCWENTSDTEQEAQRSGDSPERCGLKKGQSHTHVIPVLEGRGQQQESTSYKRRHILVASSKHSVGAAPRPSFSSVLSF